VTTKLEIPAAPAAARRVKQDLFVRRFPCAKVAHHWHQPFLANDVVDHPALTLGQFVDLTSSSVHHFVRISSIFAALTPPTMVRFTIG
jgi:hypothetical protein